MNARLIPVAFVSGLLLSPAAALAASTQDHAGVNTNLRNRQNSEHKLVMDAASAVKRAKSDQHFADLMKQAKGVFVMPNLVKGAAIVGGQGGQGVLLARQGTRWSDPAFLSTGSISIGAQGGGEAGPVVMLLMSDKALNDFVDANNFSLNANAGLTIVNYSARRQAGVGIVLLEHLLDERENLGVTAVPDIDDARIFAAVDGAKPRSSSGTCANALGPG